MPKHRTPDQSGLPRSRGEVRPPRCRARGARVRAAGYGAVARKVGVEFRLPGAEMMSYNGTTWWPLGPLSGPADGPSAQLDI